MNAIVTPQPLIHDALLSQIDLDNADVMATRNRAILAFSVDSIQHLNGDRLVEVQTILRHGGALGTWATPVEWLTPGTNTSLLSINLRRRIVHFLPEQMRREATNEGTAAAAEGVASPLANSLNLAVLTLTRYLLLLRIGPSGMGRRGSHQSLGPSSILDIAYSYCPALLAQAVARQVGPPRPDGSPSMTLKEGPRQEAQLLSGVTLASLSNLTGRSKRYVLAECKRMRMLEDRGLWCDLPSLNSQSRAAALTGPAKTNEPRHERNPHLPLPDDYVAEMGRRSLWLMRDLAPNVLALAHKMTELWAETAETGWVGSTVRDLRSTRIRSIIDAQEWRTQEGMPFSSPPFPLRLPGLLGFARTAAGTEYDDDEPRWPPLTYKDVIALLGLVQLAHYFVVALSMGARQSEALGLKRDCVSYANDGRAYANGRTYKLVQRHEGELRDWLLPDAAVEAIEQQVRVVSLGEELAHINPDTAAKSSKLHASGSAATHLWAQLSASGGSDATVPLRNINQALVSFARALCMDTAPSGQNLRSHRFRKTLARLVALALTQAPKLLMEVFGHKSIEMTLYYILTDKDLRAEIDTVSRELRVMRAKEIVERMVEADLAGKGSESGNLGGYGGLGYVAVMSAIGVHRDRVHRRGEQWGANNVMELAELLTLQGKAWEQVRPGVLCTKFPGEAGPCNKSKGRPEPSKCQSSCGHRLEEAFLREDVDGSIRESLVAYEKALADDEMLTSAHWAAQVRAHVPRFPDLRDKWMQNATVQALMGSEPGAVIA